MAEAIRNPRGGKAHRRTRRFPRGFRGDTDCGKSARRMTETVPVESTDPAERCRRCFKEAKTDG